MLEFTPHRRIPGGLRLETRKEQSTRRPIAPPFIPDRVVIPVTRRAPEDVETTVKPGQRVGKGQKIAAAPPGSVAADAHASTSGTVRAIETRPVPTGLGIADALCVVIECDGEDEWEQPESASWSGDRRAQLEAIRRSGIVGLGGAAFPTAIKLETAVPGRTVIINGTECEPYISCDDMLMRRSAGEVVAGSLLLCDLVEAASCIIAIERDKPEAIEAMRGAARDRGDERVQIASIPTVYPSGGERQLVELLTGREVPSDAYPSTIGCICHNVGTAYALDALRRTLRPLVSRIVTVTGGGVAEPGNSEVLLGTPIGSLIEHHGGYLSGAARLIVGGNMMGYAVPRDDFPITKATNCILVATAEEVSPESVEWPCIRCGDCAHTCPVRLLPQELLRAARKNDQETLDELGLVDCIECGCCDVVCPSNIPLTKTFQTAKVSQREHRAELSFSDASEARFRERERRRETEALEQDERRRTLVEGLRDGPGERARLVAEAVERAARRRDRDTEGER